jgi:rubrerythrin
LDLSKPSTHANLEAAFGGESMANRKYLFFADVARKLGHKDLAKLFHVTAAQETEHAFAHFRLLHPELVVNHPDQLSDEEKQAVLSRCLELAIEGETYEYTTMYPEFTAQARQDRDSGAEAEFAEQTSESKEHAGVFRTAAKNFGLLTPIEQHHAETYGVALEALQGKGTAGQADQPIPGKWICKVCSVISTPPRGTRIPGSLQALPLKRFPTIGTARSVASTKPASFPTAKLN